MGNSNIKFDSSAINKECENICLICREIIQKNHLVSCSRCNIQLHDFCHHNYNKIKKYTFKICPNCKRIGTLGVDLNLRHVFEKTITTTKCYL